MDVLDESHKELRKQMDSQGYAVLDEKTIPAIEQIVGAAVARQEGAEAVAGPQPEPSDGVEFYENIGGNCPVQATGWFTGADGNEYAFYFRARGSSWSVDIGDGKDHLYPDKQDDPKSLIAQEVDRSYGVQFEAGWMTRAEAGHIINGVYRSWLTAGGPTAPREFELDFEPPQPTP